MFITFEREWTVRDAAKKGFQLVSIPAGRYEAERIPNPNRKLRGKYPNWIVLKGSLIGEDEAFFRKWHLFIEIEE